MAVELHRCFFRERSFVETNFVQTPRSTNVTQILPERNPTPGKTLKRVLVLF